MDTRRTVGAEGERVAAHMLRDQGWEVLATNWRCARGEIDIVAHDRATDEVVFVEVKTRRGGSFGHPAEAVTAVKLRRLRGLAGEWLAGHGTRATGIRIDVVSVLCPAGGPPEVEHLRGVG